MSFMLLDELIDSTNGLILTREEVVDKRMKEGMCLTCPNKLYQIKRSKFNPFKVNRVPLTVEGKVLGGRCLCCCPKSNDLSQMKRQKFQATKPQALPKSKTTKAVTATTTRKAVPKTVTPKTAAPKTAATATTVPKTVAPKTDDNRSRLRPTARSMISSRDLKKEKSLSQRQLQSMVELPSTRDLIKEVGQNFDDEASDVPSLTSTDRDMLGDSQSTIDDAEDYDKDENKMNPILDHDHTDANAGDDASFHICKVIEDMLSDHGGSSAVQRKRCKLLLAQSENQDDSIKSKLIASGALFAIRQMMNEHHLSDQTLQQTATKALNYLLPSTKNHHLEDLDFVQTILNVMNKYPRSQDIQQNGINILINLSVRNDDFKDSIAHCGAIQTVMFAMTMHPFLIVQRNGCGFLWSMSTNSENREDICEEGGCNLMVDAMNDFRNDEPIQHYACGALMNLSLDDDNRDIIGHSGAIQSLIDAMELFPQSEDIQKLAMEALSFLVEE